MNQPECTIARVSNGTFTLTVRGLTSGTYYVFIVKNVRTSTAAAVRYCSGTTSLYSYSYL